MRALVDQLALLMSAGSLVSAAVCLLGSRQPRQALFVLLDLLMAAGLLRLAIDPTYQRAAVAGSIVVLRHLIVFGLTPRVDR